MAQGMRSSLIDELSDNGFLIKLEALTLTLTLTLIGFLIKLEGAERKQAGDSLSARYETEAQCCMHSGIDGLLSLLIMFDGLLFLLFAIP